MGSCGPVDSGKDIGPDIKLSPFNSGNPLPASGNTLRNRPLYEIWSDEGTLGKAAQKNYWVEVDWENVAWGEVRRFISWRHLIQWWNAAKGESIGNEDDVLLQVIGSVFLDPFLKAKGGIPRPAIESPVGKID